MRDRIVDNDNGAQRFNGPAGATLPGVEPAFLAAIPELPVQNLQAALQFYEDVLGFEPLLRSEGHVDIVRGGAQLRLLVVSDPTASPGACWIAVDGLDALRRELMGRVETSPCADGGFSVSDPDGNLLAFMAGAA